MNKIIGVVGGMGTYAGIDLLKKIADNTTAGKDQDHLPVIMHSYPDKIADRSEYLFDLVDENPGHAIAEVLKGMLNAGANVFGIPCNTAHVPEILKPVKDIIPGNCILVNMVAEVAEFIAESFREVKRVGVLGTNGVYKSRVYDTCLIQKGLTSIYPDDELQYKVVHPAIYDPGYGIKAQSDPVTGQAVNDLKESASYLHEKGAEVIILGCTEIPLALKDDTISGIPLIDASDVLAKSLVKAAVFCHPERSEGS